ncbi:hypothetical protein [Seonamhaeicola maritimus]|uniref:Uncharacterized protein n=1 Tax=Seonamhaeicola maritimus TaxID=2591822 RepID=A0A5C7GMP6_9FLAO|nr:hypothetical protein [Seonamhaeicola maritimus]TXG39565.1 hypothetical protein FUA22_06770 [Seonamhaeicola maritimus]
MIHLNYNNLETETQERLLSKSKEEIQSKFGDELKVFSKQHELNYDELLYEEAVKNLYNYKFKFQI